MKSLITSLLYAAVVGGIGASLAGKAYRKHIQSLAALLCAALVLSPLAHMKTADLKIGSEYEDALSVDSAAAGDLIMRQAEEDAENAVKNYIFSKTGIKVPSVGICFESRDGEAVLSSVSVKAANDAEAETVRRLLSEELCISAEVTCEG